MTEIIKKRIGRKYAIVFDRPLTMVEVEIIRSEWDKMINSHKTEIFILDSRVKLIKIDTEEE